MTSKASTVTFAYSRLRGWRRLEADVNVIFMTRTVSDNTLCTSATTGVLERFFQFSFAVPLVPGVLVQQLLKSIINEHVLDRIRFQKGVDHEPWCLVFEKPSH